MDGVSNGSVASTNRDPGWLLLLPVVYPWEDEAECKMKVSVNYALAKSFSLCGSSGGVAGKVGSHGQAKS